MVTSFNQARHHFFTSIVILLPWLISFQILAGQARCQLICRSLRFTPDVHGPKESLAFTVADTLEKIDNGELGPRWVEETNKVSGFYRLQTIDQNRKRIDDVTLLLPLIPDSNNNGVPDFYESSLPVEPSSTSGEFEDPQQNLGNVSVTWSRPAGSAVGACEIQLVGSAVIATFDLPFTLLEYSGTLDYAVTTNGIKGSVAMTNETQSLTGSILFKTKSADELEAASSGWVSGNNFLTWISGGSLHRTGNNFVGDIIFADGDPGTSIPDYRIWTLWISDFNYTNHNGIPDLSEPPAAFLPPTLAIARSADGFQLTLAGNKNRTYAVERTAQLPASEWQTIQTFVLTNEVQSLTLPADEPTAFWRASLR